MGFWGITMRQSDYGLDLLETIADIQPKAANFSIFNVVDTLEVIDLFQLLTVRSPQVLHTLFHSL